MAIEFDKLRNPNSLPIVAVRNLWVRFIRRSIFGSAKSVVAALQDVSIDLMPRKTLALVGPSGCGKSTLARCLLALEKPSSGHIFYKNQDILTLKYQELKSVRRDIHLVFQDSASALNPSMTVERILIEPMTIQEPLLTAKERLFRLAEALERSEVAAKWLTRRPQELSGGQRQRVAIARALVSRATILILDEALTALDLSTQAQMANLLLDLQDKNSLSYLCITHDLRVARMLAHDVAVMNSGRIVERHSAWNMFTSKQQTDRTEVQPTGQQGDTGGVPLTPFTYSEK